MATIFVVVRLNNPRCYRESSVLVWHTVTQRETWPASWHFATEGSVNGLHDNASVSALSCCESA